MTLNKSMASSMTQLTQYVIKFKPIQLPMSHSCTYSQMLRKADHTKFFEAMEIEINDHEARRHWDLMLRTDLPLGSKTIIAIWSFK